MTQDDKRFWAACAAMQGMLANPLVWATSVASPKDSLQFADALLSSLSPAEPEPDIYVKCAQAYAERDEARVELEDLTAKYIALESERDAALRKGEAETISEKLIWDQMKLRNRVELLERRT